MVSHYLKSLIFLIVCFCPTLYAAIRNPVQFEFRHPDEKLYLNCSQKPYRTVYDTGPLLTFVSSSAPSIYYNYQLAFPTYEDCMMAKDKFAELYDTLIAKNKPGTYTIYARTDRNGKAHFQLGYVERPNDVTCTKISETEVKCNDKIFRAGTEVLGESLNCKEVTSSERTEGMVQNLSASPKAINTVQSR